MKRIPSVALILVVLALALAAAPLLASESYKIDSDHTYVLFKVKHLKVGNSYGRFNGPTGTFSWDDANPANSNFEVTVPAANVDTDNDKRDKHLRSADFFNVGQYAAITFKSTAIKKVGDDTYKVSGNLTLLGQTFPITVTAVQTGHGKDPWNQ
ncbi:MAG: YceI family protein [Desulfosarcina sp.]|nr:YceI family protein [Desulfobacterales bacterium]